MEKVLYIFGAGFSAPLGLPVMSNFLIKSKDMYFQDPARFKNFKKVFDLIEKMSVSKNYYNTDLLNIEEILSILDMQSFLGKQKLNKTFLEYICAVINFSTPELAPVTSNYFPRASSVFGEGHQWKKYAAFFANLCRLSFHISRTTRNGQGIQIATIDRHAKNAHRYGALTLNYDCVPEIFSEFCTASYKSTVPIGFQKDEMNDLWEAPVLAKLHGCSREGKIIPPTWNKGSHSSIIPAWKLAYRLLTEANHIRFIGYSLPASDSYVKYLLKAASLNTPHLKTIDVICWDPDGSVQSRFKDFIGFQFFRFANARTEVYLDKISQRYEELSGFSGEYRHDFSHLEPIHEAFMQSQSN